jgi:cytochrome c553
MWKRSLAAIFLAGVLAAALAAQQQALPPGPMQERARQACLACHDARIIVQQQLDRRGWARVMDKMIRWGTPVEAGEREALIDYFAQHYGEREAAAEAALPAGPGADAVRAACLGCHDAGVIAAERLDRRGWSHLLDKMVRWGAAVRAEDREAILNYLARHYAPAPRAPQAAPGKTPQGEK